MRMLFILLISFLLLSSCEDFLNPAQDLIVRDEDLFKDWQEYRSAAIGMYSLQQDLVEQIVILGELRGDLMMITENAPRDMIEINNFEISESNEFASPTKIYKLIACCNNLIRKLEEYHPEVISEDSTLSNYDYLYGEVRCMLAWSYFNAVRIYGKVPYVPSSLTSIEEIDAFIETGGEFIDSVDILFPPNGLPGKADTLISEPINYDGYAWLDMHAIIDLFTNDLEENVKAVGVNHWIDNGDETWDACIWNEAAMHCLLGQMYLYEGDYIKSQENFRFITEFRQLEGSSSNLRYGLDNKFSGSRWKNIFAGIDLDEHILALPFDKSNQQQNELQYYFSIQAPNAYYIKPTIYAVNLWETIWQLYALNRNNTQPELTQFKFVDGYNSHIRGVPGDLDRGHGISYAYFKNGSSEMMKNSSYFEEDKTVESMFRLRMFGKDLEQRRMMEGVDTVIYKYTYGKGAFDHDAYFTIFRATSIHLYMAEILARLRYYEGGTARDPVIAAQNYINDGSYLGNPSMLGVRGRVGQVSKGGFGADDWKVNVENDIIFKHDPFTNNLIFPPIILTGNLQGKQEFLVDMIIDERARELAYEGERFYDLMRIAKRRNLPEFLAMRVASKFADSRVSPDLQKELLRSRLTPSKYEELYQRYLAGSKAGAIYTSLLDEGSWYVDFNWIKEQ
jgi:starch-binding outer membrane protein, SusD/RagB family